VAFFATDSIIKQFDECTVNFITGDVTGGLCWLLLAIVQCCYRNW